MGIARESAKLLAVNVAKVGIGVGAFVVTTRLLGPEGRGLLSLAFNFPNLVLLVGGLGLSTGGAYFLAKNLAPERQIASTLLWSGLVVGLAWLAVLAMLYLLMPASLPDGYPVIVALLAATTIPFQLANQYSQGQLLHHRWIGWVAFFTLVPPLLTTAAVAIVVLWLLPGATITSQVICLLGVQIGVVACLTAVRLFVRRSTIGGAPSISLFTRMMKFSWPVTLSSSAMWLLQVGDQYYLSQLAPTDAIATVGVYSAAFAIVALVNEPHRAARTIMFRDTTQAGPRESDRLVAIAARRLALLTAGAAAAMYLAAPYLLHYLAGEQFRAAVEPAAVLLLSSPLYAMGAALSHGPLNRGNSYAGVVPAVSAALLNLGLNILWIPEHGMMGAAWATVVAFGVLLVARTIVFAYYAGLKVTAGAFIPRLDDLWFFASKVQAGIRIMREGISPKR